MNTSERIMRCQIEGSWTAKEMASSLMSFRDLYSIRLGLQVVVEDQRAMEEFFMELRHFPPFRRRLKSRWLHPLFIESLSTSLVAPFSDLSRVSQLVYPHEELKVRRVEYASPGFKDLAGFGEIVGHVKDFTLRLIEHFSSSRQRELQNQEQELRNDAMRIQNARDFVSLAKECGVDESELRLLVQSVDQIQEPLVRLVSQGQIQTVEMLDESNLREG